MKYAKFLAIHAFIKKLQLPVAFLLSLAVGFVRYIVCKSFSCALGYAVNTFLYVSIAFIVYGIIASVIIKQLSKRNTGAPVSDDKENPDNGEGGEKDN